MTFFTEPFDRWRERQAWIPAWIDDTPWKSWFITHTGITLFIGLLAVVIGIVINGAIGWSVVDLAKAFALGTRIAVAVYLLREYNNLMEDVRDRDLDWDLYHEGLIKREDIHPLNLLDHTMDWLVPMLISESINQGVLHV